MPTPATDHASGVRASVFALLLALLLVAGLTSLIYALGMVVILFAPDTSKYAALDEEPADGAMDLQFRLEPVHRGHQLGPRRCAH